jgi:acetoacetyl-CoA synthetase
VIENCFSENAGKPAEMTILDSLCIGQKIGSDKSDERVLLFVKLAEGVQLSETLQKAIASEIRGRRSARHVPAKVSSVHFTICVVMSIMVLMTMLQCIQVDDIPYTLNGKKVEVPVRKVSTLHSTITFLCELRSCESGANVAGTSTSMPESIVPGQRRSSDAL